ncbi:hypothetical protein ACZ87_03995, partial [Candidatus Erwinia dacicola]
MLRTF